jgi:DNA-binding MarR family transcriptional regulator
VKGNDSEILPNQYISLLIQRALIERVRSDSDRRVVSVAISRKGQDTVKQGLALYRKLIEKATHNVTEKERRNLLAILDKMIASVQED